MLACRLQGDALGPSLKHVAIEPEAEIAAQGDKARTLPVSAECIHAGHYLTGTLLHALGQQAVHPAVHPQWGHRGKYVMAAGKLVGVQECLVIGGQRSRHLQAHLRYGALLRGGHLAVGILCDVQHDAVIGGIGVVSVTVPIRRAQVNLHVARPQHAVYQHLGIEEVGPTVAVVRTRVYHFHPPSVRGAQVAQGQYAVLPYVVQQFLHTCKVILKVRINGPRRAVFRDRASLSCRNALLLHKEHRLQE